MNARIEPTACACCGSAAPFLLRTADVNHRIDATSFDYFRCSACGLIFIQPIPADLGKYYDSAYPPYSIPATVNDLVASASAVRWRVDFVKRHIQNGRILEIGPSYGAFTYAAIQAGYSVDAVEMDTKCCEFINRHINGAKAINTADVVDGLSKLEGRYDAVVLWHNIEHLPNPWAAVAAISGRLREGGIMVLSTPNPDSLQFRLFGRHWLHLDAPRHLYLIPSKMLADTASRSGLQQFEFTTNDPDGLMLNRMSWDSSLAHAMGIYKGHWAHRLRKLLSKLLRLFVTPAERLLDRGCAYTAVYRKA